jgi:A/G-specific adenine glycosylase
LRRWWRRRLLTWFRRHRRDLPWRRNRDPYAIWVSEVMLQQTQVATVIPFFERFLQTFPTLTDLAAADERAVLRLWEGLGYYRRARNLHKAARQLVAANHQQVPDDPAILGGLPGIGRYTLGAILSQAFDRPLPILEANSVRVLCRFFGLRGDPRSGATQRQLWQLAEDLLPRRHVGEFNQAVMELGALVCTPTAPACGACPLAEHCTARRLHLQEQIPRRPDPPQIVEVHEVAVVVRRGRRVLLLQRPEHGRWAGLWEFPHGPLEHGETHEEAGVRLLRQLANVQAVMGPELLTVRHSVTRFRITLVGLEAEYQTGDFQSAFYRRGCWLKPAELLAYPVSAPQRRLARTLTGVQQRRLF